MVKSNATTVTEYLNSLPPDRKKILTEVRKLIKKNLPKGYVEVINWGMISYEIPLKTYSSTYNKKPLMFLGLANQKNYLSLHLMCAYGNTDIEEWFKSEWKKTGKKLDMGKGCLRFKKIDDLPLELLGRLIKKVPMKAYITNYENGWGDRGQLTAKGKS